jgi:hypothetical protein
MLNVFTIVLDGMPFIGSHLPILNTLKIDWRWVIAEGAAMNVRDTGWCREQTPRLSTDGTTSFLKGIRSHPRITVLQANRWDGKVEMVNACLAAFNKPGVLLQMDSDEMWTAEQLVGLMDFFHAYEVKSARFLCRYFVGPNLIITSRNTYGNRPGEWHRAWRFEPGMEFISHEPPRLNAVTEPCATREQTEECGLVFEHYAYVLQKQVAYKEDYYGYHNAVQHWLELQADGYFPGFKAKLADYLPWVKDDAIVESLH